MRLNSLKNLPVFYQPNAEIIGKIDHVVLGDDFQILYIVLEINGQGSKMIAHEDFQLTSESMVINDLGKLKSYSYGEEFSVYDKKIGDMVFDQSGKELGWVSDFLLTQNGKCVWGVEISAGTIPDFISGRVEIPLEKISWLNPFSALAAPERREKS
ncbi:MAG: PRC-barrel domain-containing protein [Syntrophomonadaceae bacterium]|nr:PRC-barrel domain-containing protein [Syntrophomonadaceae bacterium]